MDDKKQKLLLEYLISSSDVFSICQGIVQPRYFAPELRKVVTFIKNHYQQYNSTPDIEQVEAECNVVLAKHEITKPKLEYCTTEIEQFCKNEALKNAIFDSVPLYEKGDSAGVLKLITDAVMVSLNKNLGLRYFDDPAERLKRMLENPTVESTGWKIVDELLYGGLSRKEMLLVSANSGGGKSITLANLGLNMAHRGLNVLYISLELSQDVIAQRFDTMYTGISRKVWSQHVSEIITKLSIVKENCGNIDIVQMSTGTKAMDIRAYLKEYYLHYQIVPDLLIVDYLDKMYPNEIIDLGDVWIKDKLCSEQLRQLGVDYNMIVATASQLNREAVKATTHDHSHIAGGISKINESDVYWSIYMNETMKVTGQIAFIFQKTRNSDGVGKTAYLKWDNKTLRILDDDKDQLTLKKKEKEQPATSGLVDMSSSTGLLDLIHTSSKPKK